MDVDEELIMLLESLETQLDEAKEKEVIATDKTLTPAAEAAHHLLLLSESHAHHLSSICAKVTLEAVVKMEQEKNLSLQRAIDEGRKVNLTLVWQHHFCYYFSHVCHL